MKSITHKPLHGWWIDTRKHYKPDEIIKFILNNRKLIEKKITRLDNNSYIYRWTHRLLTLLSRIAGIADFIIRQVKLILLRVPGIKYLIQMINGLKDNLNIQWMIEFIRAKLYALRRHPHNEADFRVIEEIIEFSEKNGLDFKSSIPGTREMFLEKKHQLMQHKFLQEFTKSAAEKLLATQFPFNRSISPILPDSALWHKVFELLELILVKDIVLVNLDGSRISWKKGTGEKIESSDTITHLRRLEEIKNSGRRIFFVGHHEGYIGPYFVRSAIRKLGFDSLTKVCNTIAGPRMFSNIILRNGASNVGNLFMTVPSQKTTEIRTAGLADELKKNAKRTHLLIKMPEPGLKLIAQHDYSWFMKNCVNSENMKIPDSSLDSAERSELADYFSYNGFCEAMKDLSEDDYKIFKDVMHQSFLLFPEGSRSFIDPDGSVVMKYINLKFFETYMRPGDFIAPISVVGGSDIMKGWRLKPATLGISVGEPFEVKSSMLENAEETGYRLMKQIASLPNIKRVLMKNQIQFKNRSGINPYTTA